jgi:hypothetical protein
VLSDEQESSQASMRDNHAAEERFRHKVKFEDYKTSNLIKIISVTLAIIIIPLEIFVQHVLQQSEGELIINI